MAKSNMARIAEALEMQNQLFREWIVLNREEIEQSMKMKAQYFPLEMQKAQLDIELFGGFKKVEEGITAVEETLKKAKQERASGEKKG